MIHPATCVKYIDETIGHGVFATAFIPKGTILWVGDQLDRKFSQTEIDDMHELQRELVLNHSFRNNKGEYVFCWDHTRYVNHSFAPNSYPTPYGFEIAVKDIQPGEQITNDYGFLNIIEPFEPVGEPVGRKVVRPDDLRHYHKDWDKVLRDVFPFIQVVNQPLWPILTQQQVQDLEILLRNPAKMPSVIELWFNADS